MILLILSSTCSIYHKCTILYETGPIQWIFSQHWLWKSMAWCFSNRVSIATVLSTHLCICSSLWVEDSRFGSCELTWSWSRSASESHAFKVEFRHSANWRRIEHYDDVIMGTIASQITCLTSVYSTVYLGADQSKHQSSASLAFVWIPRTNGQLRGKCFHLMTSSWNMDGLVLDSGISTV